MAGLMLLTSAAMAALMLGIGIPLLTCAVRMYRNARKEPAILR
jgi:hypothetical protein